MGAREIQAIMPDVLFGRTTQWIVFQMSIHIEQSFNGPSKGSFSPFHKCQSL